MGVLGNILDVYGKSMYKLGMTVKVEAQYSF